MKRRSFVKSSLIGTTAVVSGAGLASAKPVSGNKAVIELRQYEIARGAGANQLAKYFEGALIPALNKHGVKNVGVFGEYGGSQPENIYLIIAYPSAEEYFSIPAAIKKDKNYLESSQNFHNLPPDKPVFDRYDAQLMLAFDGLPQMDSTFKGSGLYELRTYEGHSDDAVRRKVKMFNSGEIDIFKKTGLQSVFFGESIAGKELPSLTYMLAFKDMEDRDARWAVFRIDPDWEIINKDPQYANSVSRIVRKFLVPLPSTQV